MTQKQTSFVQSIEAAFKRLAQKHTEETLGDRSQYFGASDIGGCPRKTVFTKLSHVDHDISTLLRFKRGHTAEDHLAEAFCEAGLSFERQVEVESESFGVPVKAHIDFVFTSEKTKTKRILEAKSPDHMPDHPHAGWDMQTHFQVGLLAEKYPDYQVSAGIIGIQYGADALRFWNGYSYAPALFEGLKSRAKAIWEHVERIALGDELNTVPTEVSPLCGYCPCIDTCPQFQAESIPELDDYVLAYLELQDAQAKLKDELAERKSEFLTLLRSYKGSVKAGGRLLRRSLCNRTSYDTDALDEFLEAVGADESKFQKTTSFEKFEMLKIKK